MSGSPRPLAETLAQLSPEESDRFSGGDCVAFARALVEIDPDLSYAVLYYGEEDDEYTERHVVAHDENFAYDANGVRPLSEVLGSAEVSYTDLDDDAVIDQMEAPADIEVREEALRLLGH